MSKRKHGGGAGGSGGVAALEGRGDVAIEAKPRPTAYFVEARIKGKASPGPWQPAHMIFVGGRHKHATKEAALREFTARSRDARVVLGTWELQIREEAVPE